MRIVRSYLIKEGYLISVNDQYMHPVKKTKSGKWTSYTCKSPALKNFQKFYEKKFNEIIPDDDIEFFKKEIESHPLKGLVLSIDVGLPLKELFEHDVSNFIKAFEDCLSTRLGIDDSKNLEVRIRKSVFDSTPYKEGWYPISFTIETDMVSSYPDTMTILKGD